MIHEGKRLYKLGCAIHWLRANSKRPLEKGWTRGPRKKWQELEDTYRYGFNMGVRLGTPSKFKDGTYLGVIDCDVKSSDEKHLAQLLEVLKRDLPKEVLKAPTVASGRGNGSRHIYIRTKEPLATMRFTQSSEKVRVHMPSVDATKWEKAELTRDEIEEGIRMRPAFEISIMGDGSQVVLPPSIHPDTGQAYEWVKRLERFTDIPLVPLEGVARSNKKSDAPAQDFELVEVDLVSSKLPDSTVNLIMSGEGCQDRSAALFTVGLAMVKEGFTDNEILSVLTDPELYLGQCAYEHVQSSSRKRAAEWVRKYTLTKVRHELSAENLFAETVETKELGGKDTAKQEKELLNRDWHYKIRAPR